MTYLKKQQLKSKPVTVANHFQKVLDAVLQTQESLQSVSVGSTDGEGFVEFIHKGVEYTVEPNPNHIIKVTINNDGEVLRTNVESTPDIIGLIAELRRHHTKSNAAMIIAAMKI